MKSILKGLAILISSGILLRPATIAGIAIGVWLLYFIENPSDRYELFKTVIPYAAMAYFAIVFALFSNKSRAYNKLNFKALVGNIFANFFITFLSFWIFIALINFISF